MLIQIVSRRSHLSGRLPEDGPAGWLFDHDLARVLIIFLDFSLGETASPERSIRRMRKGAGILLAEIHGKYLITGWPSLGTTCVNPVVFLACVAGETLAPERSGGEQGGGRNPPPHRP